MAIRFYLLYWYMVYVSYLQEICTGKFSNILFLKIFNNISHSTAPGGDGDDLRHSMAVLIDKSKVISVLGLPLFLFLILGYTPHAWKFAFIPFIVLVKDVFVFRDGISSGKFINIWREIIY